MDLTHSLEPSGIEDDGSERPAITGVAKERQCCRSYSHKSNDVCGLNVTAQTIFLTERNVTDDESSSATGERGRQIT